MSEKLLMKEIAGLDLKTILDVHGDVVWPVAWSPRMDRCWRRLTYEEPLDRFLE